MSPTNLTLYRKGMGVTVILSLLIVATVLGYYPPLPRLGIAAVLTLSFGYLAGASFLAAVRLYQDNFRGRSHISSSVLGESFVCCFYFLLATLFTLSIALILYSITDVRHLIGVLTGVSVMVGLLHGSALRIRSRTWSVIAEFDDALEDILNYPDT